MYHVRIGDVQTGEVLANLPFTDWQHFCDAMREYLSETSTIVSSLFVDIADTIPFPVHGLWDLHLILPIQGN